jgi:hypothetical protein
MHQECFDEMLYHVNSQILKCKMKNVITMKARGCKVTGQEENPRVTSHAPGSAKSVSE